MWASIIVASILMLVLGITIMNVGGDASIIGFIMLIAIPPTCFGLWTCFTKKKRQGIDNITADLVKYIQDNKAPFYAKGVIPKVVQCGIFW